LSNKSCRRDPEKTQNHAETIAIQTDPTFKKMGLKSGDVFASRREKKAVPPTIIAAETRGRINPRENFRALFTSLKLK
jgi:hypothetical protein